MAAEAQSAGCLTSARRHIDSAIAELTTLAESSRDPRDDQAREQQSKLRAAITKLMEAKECL